MKLAIRVWKQTLEVFRKNPVLLLPFLIVGLFDGILLTLIFLAPQPPFSSLLAPPIRAFWGEQYLHYPLNFVLIPKLFNYTHIIITAVFGVLMTGLAIGMLQEAKNGTQPKILLNLFYAIKRYFAIFTIWLIMFILALVFYRAPYFFIQTSNKVAIQTIYYLAFFAVSLIQVVFIYAIPAALIERRGLISAIKRGLPFSRRYFLATLMLVMIPALFYIPIMIMKGKSLVLMNRFFPEIVLIILTAGIVVTILIDFLVTSSTTILFLNQREA